MTSRFRAPLPMLVGIVATLFAQPALAEGEGCFNDDDCPGGGQVCGGDVCNWMKPHPQPTNEKPYTCNPAGSDKKGSDGWCTTTADCKCASLGATCVGVYCTFTKPSDAPAGSGGAGAGGSGTAGAAPTAGTTSAAGTTSTAGTPSAAGTTSTAGTAGTGGTASTGGTGSMPPAAEESGCSVSSPGLANTGLAFGVAVFGLGLGLALARRRR